MRNFNMLAGAVVVLSTFASVTARADDSIEATQPKPGLIATGAVLSFFGVGHMVIAGASFASASHCASGSFCFKDMDNAVGGISLAIGGVLLAAGIPLIVYGSTAKAPRATLGVTSNGFLLNGTF
jgi:hypothetical protein